MLNELVDYNQQVGLGIGCDQTEAATVFSGYN